MAERPHGQQFRLVINNILSLHDFNQFPFMQVKIILKTSYFGDSNL